MIEEYAIVNHINYYINFKTKLELETKGSFVQNNM